MSAWVISVQKLEASIRISARIGLEQNDKDTHSFSSQVELEVSTIQRALSGQDLPLEITVSET